MKLLTKAILRALPPLRTTDGQGENAIVQVRFFQPWGSWVWLATEFDPIDRRFFGRVDGFESELGYFSLDELESVKGPGGLGIERDLHFTPKPLKDCK